MNFFCYGPLPWVGVAVDNRSHWEKLAIEYESNFNLNASVVGDLFITESISTIHKFNWKTGWVEYYHSTSSNESSLIFECEVISESYSSITSGFLFSPLYSFSLVMILVFIHKKKRRMKKSLTQLSS